jgi:hypothetical protein
LSERSIGMAKPLSLNRVFMLSTYPLTVLKRQFFV